MITTVATKPNVDAYSRAQAFVLHYMKPLHREAVKARLSGEALDHIGAAWTPPVTGSRISIITNRHAYLSRKVVDALAKSNIGIEVLDLPVSEMPGHLPISVLEAALGTRGYCCMMNKNITRLDELRAYCTDDRTPPDWMRTPNFGVKTMVIFREVLGLPGLSPAEQDLLKKALGKVTGHRNRGTQWR